MFHLLIRFLLIIGLLAGVIFVFANYRTESVADDVSDAQKELVGLIEKCGPECEEKIREIVGQAVATLSASPAFKESKPSSNFPVPSVVPKTKIEYIQLNNVGLTTRSDWANVEGTDFSYDPATYGNVKETRWIPRIRTTQGGEASSKLFDVTNGTAVPGSEVSTTNSSFTEIESGVLTLQSGKNTYRVQLKSKIDFEASFEKGKLKITTQ
ncbi:hypothetical protein HYZ78_02380 [Candidatus Microgenomates bacterium]|nr:hypothetical protein [Candidatus Microgenomates bacterium]